MDAGGGACGTARLVLSASPKYVSPKSIYPDNSSTQNRTLWCYPEGVIRILHCSPPGAMCYLDRCHLVSRLGTNCPTISDCRLGTATKQKYLV